LKPFFIYPLLHTILPHLSFNPTLNKYTIVEAGITYHMTLEHTRLLADNFRGAGYYQTGMIDEWFKKLDKKTQKEIFRTGNLPDNSFNYSDGEHQD